VPVGPACQAVFSNRQAAPLGANVAHPQSRQPPTPSPPSLLSSSPRPASPSLVACCRCSGSCLARLEQRAAPTGHVPQRSDQGATGLACGATAYALHSLTAGRRGTRCPTWHAQPRPAWHTVPDVACATQRGPGAQLEVAIRGPVCPGAVPLPRRAPPPVQPAAPAQRDVRVCALPTALRAGARPSHLSLGPARLIPVGLVLPEHHHPHRACRRACLVIIVHSPSGARHRRWLSTQPRCATSRDRDPFRASRNRRSSFDDQEIKLFEFYEAEDPEHLFGEGKCPLTYYVPFTL
jgi:hypothetical protein